MTPEDQTSPAPADPASQDTLSDAGYPRAGFRIGEYVIEDMLGHGAMSTVFLCRDSTGHEVALKVFKEAQDVPETKLERFRREIEASKQLRRHPNIMTVYAAGKEGPYQYIAMAHLPKSRTFEQLLATERLSVEHVVRIGIKIASALAYAHTHHILHRDVKPTNILIDEFGEPMLADFGVAALVDWPSLTVPGSLTGTPLYMSPEQARGERLGPASDLYSLAVVLYEALAGVMPYSSQRCSTLRETLKAVQEAQPRRLRAFREDITPDLEAVLLMALEKRPEERYADGEAFAGDLKRALEGRAVKAKPPTPWYLVRHFFRRYQAGLAVAAVVALAAGAVRLFLQNSLLEVQYDGLVGAARLRNAQYNLTRPAAGTPTRASARAMQSIRAARQLMADAHWGDATVELERAGGIAASAGDRHVLAAAEIERARCAVMMENLEEALRRYALVIEDDGIPEAAAALARFERATLALLQGGRAELSQAMGSFPPDTEGQLDRFLVQLGSGVSARQVAARVDDLSPRYRTQGWFAAAVLAQGDGDEARAEAYLDNCLAASHFSSDWPAPLARRLQRELGA